ncbi:hypothetical protein C8R44DRAFT_880041 [Mycena epipterygia]|nr:hypothetical protein C8R44DRAFT_880041 [Mycena epipterygia]
MIQDHKGCTRGAEGNDAFDNQLYWPLPRSGTRPSCAIYSRSNMFGNGVMDVRGKSHKLIFPATIERAHLGARHRQYQPPSILASNNFFRKSPTFHNRRKPFTAYKKVLGRGASVAIDYRPVQTRGQVGRPAAAAWTMVLNEDPQSFRYRA